MWLNDLETMNILERKYLKSFEMWYWRRMEKINRSEKETNEQILERIGEKRTFVKTSYVGKAIGLDIL